MYVNDYFISAGNFFLSITQHLQGDGRQFCERMVATFRIYLPIVNRRFATHTDNLWLT